MPKAIRFHQIGGPENLRFEDVPSREPGPGEVKLRVEAVGLNRAESLFFRGQYLEKPELPSRLGYEAAGVVEAVGPDVDKSWIGKRVATIPGFSQNKYGVLGEEAIVPASALGEYPQKLSAIEADQDAVTLDRELRNLAEIIHKTLSAARPASDLKNTEGDALWSALQKLKAEGVFRKRPL